MDGVRYAKSNKGMAISVFSLVVLLMAVSVVALRTAALTRGLQKEKNDRIQLACDMSFANGQALLVTAARQQHVDPEVIDFYRHNLKKFADEQVKKYDKNFECTIPKETNATDSKGSKDQTSDAEDLRKETWNQGLLRFAEQRNYQGDP